MINSIAIEEIRAAAAAALPEVAPIIATVGAAPELGFEEKDVRDVILTMERKHFYKSMTSYSNHKIWQDVYHVPYDDMILYVKFTQNTISEFTLLSFKEK